MCISPILIKNPNHGPFVRGSSQITDVVSQYIRVPCNHCFECCSKKTIQFAQRCFFMSKDYYFYFGMLSYKNSALQSIKIGDFTYSYAPYSDVQNMIKRFRNNNVFGRPFKYVFVREYGGKKHRLHWHFLLAIKKDPLDTSVTPFNFEKDVYQIVLSNWKRNISSNRRTPSYISLLDYHCKFVRGRLYSNYSCHLVESRGLTEDRVYFYLVKYLFKHDKFSDMLQSRLRETCDDSKFIQFWNLIRPRYWSSKDFGIDDDLSVKKVFLNNGNILQVQVGNQVQPISNYYIRKYMSFEQRVEYMKRFKDAQGNIVFFDKHSSVDNYKNSVKQKFYEDIFNREYECFDDEFDE